MDKSNVSFKKFFTGSRLLEDILGDQKTTSHPTRLAYRGNSYTSTSGGKTVFVKPTNGGGMLPKAQVSNAPKKSQTFCVHKFEKMKNEKFVPTCHYCGVKGHIRPSCFKPHGYRLFR